MTCRRITEAGAPAGGEAAGPVDGLPVMRQARAHAIQEGVRWGGPYVFFAAPGILSWVVPMVRGHALEGALLGGEVIAEGETEDRLEGVLHLVRSGCPHEVAEPYVNGLSSWSHGRIQQASDLLFSIFYQVSGWTPYLLQENAGKAQQQREIAEAIQRGKAGWQASPAMVGERLLLSLIRAGDRKGARQRLNKILGRVFLRSAKLAVVRALMIEMMGYLARTAVEESPHLESLLEKNHAWMAKLIDAPDFESLSLVLRDALDDFMDNIYMLGYQPAHHGVRAALDYLHEHFRDPVRLHEVAEAANLSTFRLAHLFKEHTGSTVIQYVHQLRIREAQRLLECADLSCADIAYEVGFGDQSYFTRQFRQVTGTTPAQHRRLFRQKQHEQREPAPVTHGCKPAGALRRSTSPGSLPH